MLDNEKAVSAKITTSYSLKKNTKILAKTILFKNLVCFVKIPQITFGTFLEKSRAVLQKE